MPHIHYQGSDYSCHEDETVLEALSRQGVDLPHSCRSGICQVCMHKAVRGEVPAEAQNGIDPALRSQNYFLPCLCYPAGDLEMAPPSPDDRLFEAQVAEKNLLGPDICRLLLEPATVTDYRAGQFINLFHGEHSRSYSLASVPGEDYYLELHIQRHPRGRLSAWVFDQLAAGDTVAFSAPRGECCYEPQSPDNNLLLLGGGTGLAPLAGIARMALAAGHRGEIHLYHGARERDGLYLHETLGRLAAEHPNFHYHPCLSREQAADCEHGRASELAFTRHPRLQGWQLYLAGSDGFVAACRQGALAAGAHEGWIRADAYGAAPGSKPESAPACPAGLGTDHLLPDPRMWAALEEGVLLNRILEEFYTRVYADPRLAPFFEGITRQRSIEKQYLFLRQVFTGEKVYFGDRPRNAHHWMVISDELFDYREGLMMETLRRHGLDETLIRRWREMEESFRGDIVKDQPWNRIMGGVEIPAEGFGEEVLEVGTLCDRCGEEVGPGVKVRYHLRLGTTYCPACAENL